MKQTAKALAIALMSVMFASVAPAQTTTSNPSKPTPATITSADSAAIRAILSANSAESQGMSAIDSTLFIQLVTEGNQPTVTGIAENGQLCGQDVCVGDEATVYIVWENDSLKLHADVIHYIDKEVTTVDSSLIATVDTAAINTQFLEKLREGKPRYRTEYGADKHVISDGRVIEYAMDKYGLSILAGGTYQLGDELNAFSGELGFSYSVSNKSGLLFLMPEVSISYRRTRYNSNAVKAGEKYWAFGTEASAFVGIAIGRHGVHRLAIGGGLGWERYHTDSQDLHYENGDWDSFRSGGNYIYPHAKLRYEFDGFNWPVSIYVSAGVRQHKSVWQNNSQQKSWLVVFEIGGKIKLFRHVTNNK